MKPPAAKQRATPPPWLPLRRCLGLLAFFGLLLLVTWGIKSWYVSEIRDSIRLRQRQAVTEAFEYIRSDFRDLQTDMLQRAQALAEAPVVVQGMQAYRHNGRAVPEELVTFFAALETDEHWSVELYDPTPRLVAWNGPRLPLGGAPNAPRFLQTYQVGVTADGTQRAVVVWWPVRTEDGVVGAIRLMRIVRFQVPVENQYLENYSLAEAWQEEVDLPVQLQYGRTTSDWTLPSIPLRDVHGQTIGRVAVTPPTRLQLIQAAQSRFNDVLAFWSTLLLFWLTISLWRWYRTSSFSSPSAPVHQQLMRAVLRFLPVAITWWGIRYALLAMDVPARWQPPGSPLAPLFNPSHLASTFGGGIMRSSGDLLITALFAFAFGLALFSLARRFRKKGSVLYQLRSRLPHAGEAPSPPRFLATVSLYGLLVLGLVTLLVALTHHALLDSTLNYFARESLVPSPLVIIVFCALLLLTTTAMGLLVGGGWIALWMLMRYRPTRWSLPVLVGAVLLGLLLPLGLSFALLNWQPLLTVVIITAFLATGLLLTYQGYPHRGNDLNLLTLRNILFILFLLTVLLYPLLDRGMDMQRRTRMRYAAELFSEGRDPRVMFAIRQVLNKAQRSLPASPSTPPAVSANDSIATELLRGSLLSSLTFYDVSLTFFDSTGTPVGRSDQAAPSPGRSRLNRIDSLEFSILQQMYAETDTPGALVERITGRREGDRFQYVGIIPFSPPSPKPPTGWIMVRAEPQLPLHGSGTVFPRVLLPAGQFGNPYNDLSLAEFEGGMLVRSFGRNFGRYRISQDVTRQLLTEADLWRTEDIEERRFLTYYQRQELPETDQLPHVGPPEEPSTVAVRAPAINLFDHLYYLLRLTVASLILGALSYLFGLYLRWRHGMLPATRIRFRDKILNAFLGVGLVTVTAVGFVGLQVVTEENERALQSWLRQYLERVETTLALEAVGGERPYEVIDRMRVDSLSSRVGLDLNLYTDQRLVDSSRPQLIRENLIDERLPIKAVKALYYDGYRFTYTEERVGSYTYTTGFRTLLDEQGQPRYVVAVPTLPEQERIEEERTRTVAYLFGALLLLVLVVMLTASLIARALTRPLARLRRGLEAVAHGRFEHPLPVSTRDEIGELVKTFNDMQKQLAESRRKLAQQERELAWREMARQVAHEIKNPLTPMKLSLQHLRRTFEPLDLSADGAATESIRRFKEAFDRITTTLIEQIDALARIANEFHSFARMPSRSLEELDLNEVVREAVSLMQEEASAEIHTDLYDQPLHIKADREELRRIYINLIKNAFQAIPEGQQGRIELTTALEEDGRPWAVSTVRDNGTGIAPEVREKIFQPNFSTKTSGTGLGLAIVQKGINDLKGTIDFETEEGVGTTFRMRIPLAQR